MWSPYELSDSDGESRSLVASLDVCAPNGKMPSSLKLDLHECLAYCTQSITGPGSFAGHCELEDVNPGLFIEGLGAFGVPLSVPEIHRIIQQSHQAPFGKGEETLVDTNVRKTWEVDGSKLSLRHPRWQAKEREILESACAALGVPRGAAFVDAQLYKLLIYEPGALFKPHKDTEKADRMFGTLVICLPSEHQGGDLVLSIGGASKVIKSSANFGMVRILLHLVLRCFARGQWGKNSPTEEVADSQQVKPVTSGYRVALTFNLVHRGPSGIPNLKSGNVQHEILKNVLSKWRLNRDSLQDHLVYMLKHEYTDANLTLSHLKSQDYHQASALANAAREVGYEMFLCNIERRISGSADDDEWGYSPYSRGSSSGPHQIIEVSEDMIKLTKVVHPDGTAYLKNVEIKEADFVQANPFKGRDADDEDYEGWTGNEGAHTTQWYRSAGLLIVSKDRLLDFKLDSTGSVVNALETATMQFRNDPGNPGQRRCLTQILEIAIRKGKINSGKIGAAATVLDACASLDRLDLFLNALQSYSRGLDDAALTILAEQIRLRGLSSLRDGIEKVVSRLDMLGSLVTAVEILGKYTGQMSPERRQEFEAWKSWLLQTRIQKMQTLRRSEVNGLVLALQSIRGCDEVMTNSILPLLRAHQQNTAVLFEFVHRFHEAAGMQKVDCSSTSNVLTEAIRLTIEAFTLKPPPPVPPPVGSYWPPIHFGDYNEMGLYLDAREMTHLFKLLVAERQQHQIPQLLDRINGAVKGLSLHALDDGVLPFMRDVLSIAKANTLDWKAIHYQNFFTDSLRLYVTTALQMEPPAPRQIEPIQIGCGCQLCQRLDRFLANNEVKEEGFREYAKERRHLEDRLSRIRTKPLLHWFAKREGKGPEVLHLQKLDGHYEHRQWRLQRKAVAGRVAAVGSWPDLSALLGSSFWEILCTTRLVRDVQLPERLPDELPGLKEPRRTVHWLQNCVVADSTAAMTQAAIWSSYSMVMDIVPEKGGMLPTDRFVRTLGDTFRFASFEASPPYRVKGVRLWQASKDGGSSGDARQPLYSLPNSGRVGAPPQRGDSANSLKRKIDIVDLCESP